MTSHRFVTLARASSAVLIVAALALAGCGGKSSSKKSTTAKPAAPSASSSPEAIKAANQQFHSDVTVVNAARNTFTSRADPDARAGNIAAFQGDAAQYRTAVFNFDGAIRKIQFPSTLQADVNSVLDANKTLIADLDAVGSAKTLSEVNRLNGRANSDFLALKSVGNKLYRELSTMAKGAGP